MSMTNDYDILTVDDYQLNMRGSQPVLLCTLCGPTAGTCDSSETLALSTIKPANATKHAEL